MTASINRALALAVLAACVYTSDACIYEYGSLEEAAALAGGHYTYSYNGLEWTNDFPQCRGLKQSPILLPSMGAAAGSLKQPAAKSSFSYGSLTNPTIVNNGHTLQVSLPADFESNVRIPIKGDPSTAKGTSIVSSTNSSITYVKATPAQFHFHTHSEHIISGAAYPLEMHIVHFIKPDQLPACANPGCPAVLGIMLALTRDERQVSPELRKIIRAMPLNEKQNKTVKGTMDLDALLPKNRTYFTYEGSLTTPPCSEGVLWHVLATPILISQSLLTHYQEAVGDYKCPDEEEEKKVEGTNNADTESSSKDAMMVAEDGELQNEKDFRVPPKDANGCVKLANGHNYRAAQPVNGRPIRLAV